MNQKKIEITAVWLRSVDRDHVQVLVETDGFWRLAIEERHGPDNPVGHIAEANGADKWPVDPLPSATALEESGIK